MKTGKKLACSFLLALVTISSAAVAADWKGFHGAMFRCMEASSDTWCGSIRPVQNGLWNDSTTTKSVIAPIVRDANGNMDIWVFFKTLTRKNTNCWAIWYNLDGTFGGSDLIEFVPVGGGASDQLHDSTIASPTSAYPTTIMCGMEGGAILTSVEYGEG